LKFSIYDTIANIDKWKIELSVEDPITWKISWACWTSSLGFR